jgi:hypothetical protein
MLLVHPSLAVMKLRSPGRNFSKLGLEPRHHFVAPPQVDVAAVAVYCDPIAPAYFFLGGVPTEIRES